MGTVSTLGLGRSSRGSSPASADGQWEVLCQKDQELPVSGPLHVPSMVLATPGATSLSVVSSVSYLHDFGVPDPVCSHSSPVWSNETQLCLLSQAAAWCPNIFGALAAAGVSTHGFQSVSAPLPPSL